jgi:hypothetical protein
MVRLNQSKVPLLRPIQGVALPDLNDTSSRTAFFYLAIILQLIASAIAGVGFSINSGAYWLAGSGIWLLWFVTMFTILGVQRGNFFPHHANKLKRVPLIVFIALFTLGVFEVLVFIFVVPQYLKGGAQSDFARVMESMAHTFQYNDGTALSQQATENLLDGKNPYTNANIVEALLKYEGSFDRVTPLRTGQFAGTFPYPTNEQLKELWDDAILHPSPPPAELESGVCYPAGSFLLTAPFVAAGISDIRIVYALFVLAGIGYALWRIPQDKRLLFAGAAIISLELWNSIAGGETGSLVFPLLLISWLTAGKNIWLSAVFMGLAVTTKQTAWFIMPFYLVLLYSSAGPKKTLLAAGIIAGIFFATNAYFIALDPGLWVKSVLSPMIEPMFPIGVGVVTLVTSGVLDIRSSLPFTILEAMAFVAALAWYIRYCPRYPYTGPLIAVVPIFFAWRSLWCYFFYVTLIVFASFLIDERKVAEMDSTQAA